MMPPANTDLMPKRMFACHIKEKRIAVSADVADIVPGFQF
jgi:hypothetical protein